MAMDFSVFKNILGDEFGQYEQMLGNTFNTPPAAGNNASIYGFDPDRAHGVKSLQQLMDDDQQKHIQSRARSMLENERNSQAGHQKEMARIQQQAQLEAMQNQMRDAANQRGRAAHESESMNMYYNALQNEQIRQKNAVAKPGRAYSNWGEVVKDGVGMFTNPLSTLGGMAARSAAQPPVIAKSADAAVPPRQSQMQQQKLAALQSALRGKYGNTGLIKK